RRNTGALWALLSAILAPRHAGADVYCAKLAQPGRRTGADRRDSLLLPAAAPGRLLVHHDHAEYVVRCAAGWADYAGGAADRAIHRRIDPVRGVLRRNELVGPARATAHARGSVRADPPAFAGLLLAQ